MTDRTFKTCCSCKTERLASQFHKSRSTSDGLDPRCKSCRKTDTARRPREPQRVRANSLQRLYGISPAEYDALFAAQAGLCAICRKPESMERLGVLRGLCVDHDHKTGKVRGLLCARCNVAIGHLTDDPAVIHAAARYLLGIESELAHGFNEKPGNGSRDQD